MTPEEEQIEPPVFRMQTHKKADVIEMFGLPPDFFDDKQEEADGDE